MGLSAFKSVRLDAAGMIEFFEKKEKLWRSMAEHALGYAEEFVTEAEEQVRPDDVVQILVPALEVSKPLRTELAKKSLSQQYWYLWFGELIIDRLWDGLPIKRKRKRKGR